ncbi:MAG TPA: glycosyltransferase [Candidatus Polarisedimenticolia bacterium]|nr:glycosyltransferase [Candidatus Polarisedimenticolia bacterium]
MTRTPIRVLAIVNSLGFGGTERMLERLAVELQASGRVAMTVASLEDVGAIGARLQARGIEVLAFGGRGSTLRIVGGGFLTLRRLMRRRRFDLIHSFLYRSHCAARLTRLFTLRRVPLISSERCLGDNRSPAALWINRVSSPLSTRILAVSEAVAERLESRDRVPRSRIAVVRNGIEAVEPSPRWGARLRCRLGIAPEEAVLLLLGRLHAEKGPDLLLEALALMDAGPCPPWRALLVGDGPEAAALKDLARRRGLQERVFFAGSRGFVAPWIEACDLLVLPSREEGLPVAPLEAMARGKPVVASRVGGSGEVVVDGVTGRLVPPEDPAALAVALSGLISSSDLRRRLGSQALERVRSEFSIQRMARDTLNLYDELLLSNRGSRLDSKPQEPLWQP